MATASNEEKRRSSLELKVIYPPNVMHPGDKIKKMCLKSEVQVENYVDIIVTEICDPSKFFIQIKESNITYDLSKIMYSMQVYYLHYAEFYRMNQITARKGLYCAAFTMNKYHRAIITEVYDSQTLKVFCIDIGKIALVELQRTCFLHKEFGELPEIAIKACLADIIPADRSTSWTQEAITSMQQLLENKSLIAYIYPFDNRDEVLKMVIAEKQTTKSRFHINDVLIDNGFAVAGNLDKSSSLYNFALTESNYNNDTT